MINAKSSLLQINIKSFYLSSLRSFVLHAQERRRSSLQSFRPDTRPYSRHTARNPTYNSPRRWIYRSCCCKRPPPHRHRSSLTFPLGRINRTQRTGPPWSGQTLWSECRLLSSPIGLVHDPPTFPCNWSARVWTGAVTVYCLSGKNITNFCLSFFFLLFF